MSANKTCRSSLDKPSRNEPGSAGLVIRLDGCIPTQHASAVAAIDRRQRLLPPRIQRADGVQYSGQRASEGVALVLPGGFYHVLW